MCDLDEIKPSKHSEFGTVLRVKLKSNITMEHLGIFCNLSNEFSTLFGNAMAVTSAKIKASTKNIQLTIVDPETNNTIAEFPARMALSTVKESDEETPDRVPAVLNFITEIREDDHDVQHALSLKLKQSVVVNFSETQYELFHTMESEAA
jgi:hypothetical protein